MADKVASADIEDVVSSIRRLVSDEGSARRVAPPEAEDDGRLLLTPALRVLPKPDDADGDGPLGDSETPAGTSTGHPEFEHREPSTLEATIAELEAAVVRHPEFEPDGGESGSVLDLPPSLRRDSGHDATAPRRRLTLGLADTSPDDGSEPPAPVSDTRRGGAAGLASDLSGTLHLVEPVAEPAPSSGTEAGDEPEGFEEVLLDEDTLRQLVAQFVREELQGALGEQITSNIRKLIRREIHDYFDVRDGE